MKTTLTLILILWIISPVLDAQVIEVPGDYSTIQAAINASSDGDTIVVSPATYFENINFRGKNVFLTSLYYLAADTSYISSTIINGSSPVFPDTASVVIFNSGEDTTAVIQGFTITGGAGTKWLDIHGAGTYREGGGILVELSSPMIRYNVIRNNACTDLSGVTSTGGGGIRVGDGYPVIRNNSIIFNEARYGAGIVLNYTGCVVLNNIIASNTGGQDYYGGSGIWIYGNMPGLPKYIVNNTIVNNTSSLVNGTGGISVWSAAIVMIRNNIVYYNLPFTQIKATGSSPTVSYSDVQLGYTGIGNIGSEPLFDPESYILDEASPCVDAGDTAAIFNDPEDMDSPGTALFPSRGTLRNDMGAYGGPYASILPYIQTIVGISDTPKTIAKGIIYPNPSSGQFTVEGEGELRIYNPMGKLIYSSLVNNTVIDLGSYPDGIYFVKMMEGKEMVTGKLILQK
jgi:hypothetical protein